MHTSTVSNNYCSIIPNTYFVAGAQRQEILSGAMSLTCDSSLTLASSAHLVSASYANQSNHSVLQGSQLLVRGLQESLSGGLLLPAGGRYNSNSGTIEPGLVQVGD